MSMIERGALTIRHRAVPCGQVYSYIARCGACGLEVESPRGDMPNVGLADLRASRPPSGTLRGRTGDGDAGRPWQIVSGNDANGGNIPPFVRCGGCRGDRAIT